MAGRNYVYLFYWLLPDDDVTLNGSGTDDGTIVAYQWSQDSGPNTATLNGVTTANCTGGSWETWAVVFGLSCASRAIPSADA